jgi:hypothetical protein
VAIARLAQDEEPERARGATGKPRRIGAESGGDNAAHNISPESQNRTKSHRPERGSCVGRMALERRTIHIHDVRTDAE